MMKLKLGRVFRAHVAKQGLEPRQLGLENELLTLWLSIIYTCLALTFQAGTSTVPMNSIHLDFCI